MSASADTSGNGRRLADPDERPQAGVVVFDGECRLCRAQIETLARFDRGGRLAYLSLHDPRVRKRYPDLSHEDLMQRMYVVSRDGERRGGARAVRYLSRKLPLLWPAALLLHIPGSLRFWEWCYVQVARQRYRFGRTECKDEACELHSR